MKYDPEQKTLGFSSQAELESFHLQLGALIRSAMVQATHGIEDGNDAKQVSRTLLQEYCAVLRALNVIRGALPRKTF
jgi:hypothetical protein